MDYTHVKEAIDTCFNLLGGAGSFLSQGMNVLIKPNLCCPLTADYNATTHPLFIEALILKAQEAGCNVYVGENSGGDIRNCTNVAFQKSGLLQVIERTNAKWINFQDGNWVNRSVPLGKYLHDIYIPEALEKMDLVINAPKLKSHNITVLTGAVKNTFGCLNAELRKTIHREFRDTTRFSHAMLDVYQTITPQLTFLDAIESMEGDSGPINGNSVTTGFVLAGQDGVAVDVTAASITGHTKEDFPPVLKIASIRTIGETDSANIRLLGDGYRIVKFNKVTYAGSLDEIMFYPVITEQCVRCEACLNSCPVNAIGKKYEKIYIDHEKCIECLCCQEVCIHEAIDLKQFARREKYDEGYDIVRLESHCNLACIFCTANTPDLKSMTKKQVEEALRFLKSNGQGRVAITGGEPTLYPEIFSVINSAKQLGLKIQLQTNAVLLSDKDLATQFIEAGVEQFFVSLHSHNQECYKRITLRDKFFDVKCGIRNLIKGGGNVVLNYVINKYNYNMLEGFICYAERELGVKQFRLSLVNPNEYLHNDERVVPRLSEIHDELITALKYCHTHDLKVDVEGVPFCYMGDYFKDNIEWKRLNWPPHYHIEKDFIVEDCHRYNLQHYKAESNACSLCSLSFACGKVWKGYADIYGTSELYSDPQLQKINSRG